MRTLALFGYRDVPNEGDESELEPIRETEQALAELESYTGETGLRRGLIERARRAHALVPDLVGVSVARVQEGLTFTLVATGETIAVLDAVQYLAGGPCVRGAQADEVEETRATDDPDLLDEEGWRLFALSSAARAVRSTLTLPILDESGTAVGSVNLYAGSARAFADVRNELAVLFGAWAAGAIENADLSFATRLEALEAPQRLRDHSVVDQAVGILASEEGLDPVTAEQRLRAAAARAGVDLVELARHVIEARGADDEEGA